jgi:hypothetical protein
VLIPWQHATDRAPVVDEVTPGRLALGLPIGEQSEPALLEFEGGQPVRLSARRFKGVGAVKVGWEVTYAGWREIAGIRLPDHVEVRWADEPRPWFRFKARASPPTSTCRLGSTRYATSCAREPGPRRRNRGVGTTPELHPCGYAWMVDGRCSSVVGVRTRKP